MNTNNLNAMVLKYYNTDKTMSEEILHSINHNNPAFINRVEPILRSIFEKYRDFNDDTATFCYNINLGNLYNDIMQYQYNTEFLLYEIWFDTIYQFVLSKGRQTIEEPNVLQAVCLDYRVVYGYLHNYYEAQLRQNDKYKQAFYDMLYKLKVEEDKKFLNNIIKDYTERNREKGSYLLQDDIFADTLIDQYTARTDYFCRREGLKSKLKGTSLTKLLLDIEYNIHNYGIDNIPTDTNDSLWLNLYILMTHHMHTRPYTIGNLGMYEFKFVVPYQENIRDVIEVTEILLGDIFSDNRYDMDFNMKIANTDIISVLSQNKEYYVDILLDKFVEIRRQVIEGAKSQARPYQVYPVNR